jgi:hypothetical protein
VRYMRGKALNIDDQGRVRCTPASADSVAGQGVDNPFDDPLPPSALANRRLLVIAFPTDAVLLGPPGVSLSTGYGVRGTGRISGWAGAPTIALGQYSSRTQFLRGQYTYLLVTEDVAVHGIRDAAVEEVATLELA